VGNLARSDIHEGEFLFGYMAECPPADAVSLTMPVVRDQYDSMNTVHPVFEMDLPEGALLEKLRLRFAKAIPDFDDLALLEIVGQSQIGRLRFTGAGAALPVPAAQSISKLLA
jgi:serine/threonine-protein kinase HipA